MKKNNKTYFFIFKDIKTLLLLSALGAKKGEWIIDTLIDPSFVKLGYIKISQQKYKNLTKLFYVSITERGKALTELNNQIYNHTLNELKW